MDELRISMEQQMEVFLQKETENFISSLFNALDTKEYLNGPPPQPPQAVEEKIKTDVDDEKHLADSTTPTRAGDSDLLPEHPKVADGDGGGGGAAEDRSVGHFRDHHRNKPYHAPSRSYNRFGRRSPPSRRYHRSRSRQVASPAPVRFRALAITVSFLQVAAASPSFPVSLSLPPSQRPQIGFARRGRRRRVGLPEEGGFSRLHAHQGRR